MFGMPESSVLVPTLYVYINDLPDTVTCNVRLYVNDILLYKGVSSQEEFKKILMLYNSGHRNGSCV